MGRWIGELIEQLLQCCPELFQPFGADERRPFSFNVPAGGDADRAHGGAAGGQEYQPAAPVGWIRAALHVARAFELFDSLGHRLFAHPRTCGQLADLNTVGRDEGKDVGVWWADAGETRTHQGRVDFAAPVLMEQP